MDMVDQQTQLKKRVILVLAYNLGALEEAFKGLSRKAKKLGVPAPTYQIEAYHPERWIDASPEDPMADGYGRVCIPAKYEVTVEGEVPKLPGWDFVGVVEHTEHGNILRAMPEKSIPEEFRHAKPTCDHCGTTRQRNDTFLVNKDGELKRVGRACLKDYLGGKSPEMIAYALGLESILRMASEGDMRSGSGKQGIEIVEFLSNVVAIIEHLGYYVSKSKATQDQTPTARQALENIMNARSQDPKIKEKVVPVTQSHVETAIKMLDWVRTRECKSSYDKNLKIVSMKPVLEDRDHGLVASIAPSYNYEMGMIAKKKAEMEANLEASKNMTFVGEIGKRQNFVVTIDRVMHFENNFGTTYIITMKDESGNKLVWKTSSAPTLTHESVVEGATYKIKGTVKKYEHYRNQPQTVLQRVSFEQRLS
jgi:hypothetical protein